MPVLIFQHHSLSILINLSPKQKLGNFMDILQTHGLAISMGVSCQDFIHKLLNYTIFFKENFELGDEKAGLTT